MSDDCGYLHSICRRRYTGSGQNQESVYGEEEIKSRSSKHIAYEQVQSYAFVRRAGPGVAVRGAANASSEAER
jgi:hypothetical protein